MALITCSECGAQVSDKADSCVQCGAPLASSDTVLVIRRERKLGAALQNWAVVVDGSHIDTLKNGGEVRISRKGGFTVQVIPPTGIGAPSPIRMDPRERKTVILSQGMLGIKSREV